jgi:hypothetical protein
MPFVPYSVAAAGVCRWAILIAGNSAAPGASRPFAGVRPGPSPLAGGLRGGNWRCRRAALSRCSRSLKAERISLIGETEFVVPQCCNLHLNRLIQWDILGNGSSVSGRAIAIFVVFMRSGTRRSPSSEQTSTPPPLASLMV